MAALLCNKCFCKLYSAIEDNECFQEKNLLKKKLLNKLAFGRWHLAGASEIIDSYCQIMFFNIAS